MDKHPRSCYLFLAQRYWFLARREGISSVQGKFQFKRAIYVAVVFFSPIFFFVLSLPAKDLFVMERSLPSSPPWQNCWKSPRHGCQQETLWRIWLGLASQKDEGNGFVENKGEKKNKYHDFSFVAFFFGLASFENKKTNKKTLDLNREIQIKTGDLISGRSCFVFFSSPFWRIYFTGWLRAIIRDCNRDSQIQTQSKTEALTSARE